MLSNNQSHASPQQSKRARIEVPFDDRVDCILSHLTQCREVLRLEMARQFRRPHSGRKTCLARFDYVMCTLTQHVRDAAIDEHPEHALADKVSMEIDDVHWDHYLQSIKGVDERCLVQNHFVAALELVLVYSEDTVHELDAKAIREAHGRLVAVDLRVAWEEVVAGDETP